MTGAGVAPTVGSIGAGVGKIGAVGAGRNRGPERLKIVRNMKEQ